MLSDVIRCYQLPVVRIFCFVSNQCPTEDSGQAILGLWDRWPSSLDESEIQLEGNQSECLNGGWWLTEMIWDGDLRWSLCGKCRQCGIRLSMGYRPESLLLGHLGSYDKGMRCEDSYVTAGCPLDVTFQEAESFLLAEDWNQLPHDYWPKPMGASPDLYSKQAGALHHNGWRSWCRFVPTFVTFVHAKIKNIKTILWYLAIDDVIATSPVLSWRIICWDWHCDSHIPLVLLKCV